MEKNQQKRKNLPKEKVFHRKPFIGHVHELRTRLFWWLIVLIVGSIIGFKIYGTLLAVIMKPLNKPLYYSSPLGGLNFVFQISILFGLIISLPMLIYQIAKFVEPVFSTHLKHLLLLMPLASFLLAVIGICFSYFISLPASLVFFNAFESGELRPLISANEYFSFVMQYLLGIAFLFQLPIILLIINFITPLDKEVLFRYQRHFIVLSLIISAILALDPANQVIMAIPLILLYYISIALIAFINRGRKIYLR